MTPAFGLDRDIVEIVDPSDIEGYLIATFDKGQITAWALDLWQVNYPNAVRSCIFSLTEQASLSLKGGTFSSHAKSIKFLMVHTSCNFPSIFRHVRT